MWGQFISTTYSCVVVTRCGVNPVMTLISTRIKQRFGLFQEANPSVLSDFTHRPSAISQLFHERIRYSALSWPTCALPVGVFFFPGQMGPFLKNLLLKDNKLKQNWNFIEIGPICPGGKKYAARGRTPFSYMHK